MLIKVRCRKCDQYVVLEIEKKDLDEYQRSESKRFIQDIFPYLKPGEREILISRFCEKCFDALTKDEEE